MRPRPDYTAIEVIRVNGVRAYNVGDDVPAAAVENLGLELGVQVKAARHDLIPRPAGNATRAEWERYALGQGAMVEDLADLTRAEIIDRYPGDAEPEPLVDVPATDPVAAEVAEQTTGVVREPPGRDGRKADWVDYAVYRGMDRDRAEESTIADLAAVDYGTLFGPAPME